MDPEIREDFPILRDRKIIYFDNACMTLKPRQVIDEINRYYMEMPVCGGRSAHSLGTVLTEAVEVVRDRVARFFNAPREGVIFTKNTTEAINIVAKGFPFERGDKVLISGYEHNSNIVPWLQVARHKGIIVDVLPPAEDLTFDFNAYQSAVSEARLVSLVHTSNLNGYTLPERDVIEEAHDRGALVMLDGAQSAPHRPVDIRQMDVDLFALSVHKMLGPTGVGVLIGKEDLLEQIEPLTPGGGTVSGSTYTSYEFLDPPERFEGGLQNYSGILGAGAAFDYLTRIGMERVEEHERDLNRMVTRGLMEMDEVEILPPLDPDRRGGICAFRVRGMDIHDVALLLDEKAGIMIRSGQHCVHSWFSASGMDGTDRISFYIYNTPEEVSIFLENIRGIVNYLAGKPVA